MHPGGGPFGSRFKPGIVSYTRVLLNIYLTKFARLVAAAKCVAATLFHTEKSTTPRADSFDMVKQSRRGKQIRVFPRFYFRARTNVCVYVCVYVCVRKSERRNKIGRLVDFHTERLKILAVRA